MATRARKAPVKDEGTQDVPRYDLEPLDEDTRSRINVMGNAMRQCVMMIRPKAPGWAQLIDDIFATIGQAVEDHS